MRPQRRDNPRYRGAILRVPLRAQHAVSARLVSDSADAARRAVRGPEFVLPAGMHCSRCKMPAPAASSPPDKIWGADRISGLRCERCGVLLGADDIALLLGEKASQLAQFGLASTPHDGSSPAPASPPRTRAIRLWKG